jgi:hypothetical protein
VSATTSNQPAEQPAGGLDPHLAEIARLREALAAAERQLLELREQRSREMARLERQTYWLDRWGIDLDRLMERRTVRLALRAAGFLRRLPARLGDRGG